MKIRTDYVSNSSSSSFIVVLPSNYQFDDFVNDVVKSCTEKQDFGYSREFLADVDKNNKNNLNYCLNAYELSFLGVVDYGNDNVYGVAMSKTNLHYMMPKTYLDDETEIENDKVECARNLIEASKNIENLRFSPTDCIELYEITRDTIERTRLLMEMHHKVTLPEWCKNLDAIVERFDRGERLFNIRMNFEGDGQTFGTIFATNGWDSEFNSNSWMETLHCE